MHELSIARAIADIAARHAGTRRLTSVHVRIGGLRQVVPDSLAFYWEFVAPEGARLVTEFVPVRLRCRDCGHEWDPGEPRFRCARCDSGEVDVTAGEELEVESIEVEEGALCTG
jgi:hydrogenase nickel incorporation protein HypA/HybF